MNRRTRKAVLTALFLITAIITIVTGCLDEPPALPDHENPWDPENPYPPRAPDSLRGRAVSEVEILLTWRDQSGNENGFHIFESVDNDTSQVLIGTTDADTCYFNLRDREPLSDYAFFIQSFNEAGVSYRAGPIFVSTRHSPPLRPTELIAQTASETSLLLSWHDRSDIETSFDIQESVGTETSYHPLATVPADCTSFVVTGRTPLVTYYYRIRAVNEYGISRFTESAWATPGNFPPVPPTALAPEIMAETEIEFRWIDESANENGFEIFESVDDSLDFILLTFAGANITNRRITGRLPVTDYYYRVRAVNDYGQSGFSETVKASTADVEPTAPIQLETGSIRATSIDLQWYDRSFNETGFQVELSTGDPDTFQLVETVPTDIDYYTANNLPIFETCFFRVRAVNGFGVSSYSNLISGVPGGYIPAAPESLDAAPVSPTEIALSWLDESGNEESFEIQESIGDINSFQHLSSLDPDVGSVILGEKQPNTTYFYRIRAVNRYGESPFSNIVYAHTPSTPDPPISLAAEGITHSSIMITWIDVSDNESGFELEESVGGYDDFHLIEIIDADTDYFTIDDRLPLTSYYYRVRAFNDIGRSQYSNVDEAMTVSVVLYVADGPAGLTVIDVTDPSNPEFGETVDTPGYANRVRMSGNRLFVADWYSGVRIFQLTDPLHPVETGFYDTPGRAYDVAHNNDFLFVADGDSGLRSIDISDLDNPEEVDYYLTPGSSFGIVLSNEHVYVADGGEGIQVFNVTKPAEIRRVGNRDTPGVACGISKRENHCFISDQTGGLQIINVTRPTTPTVTGSIQTPGYAYDVAVAGNYCFIADWNNFQVIDISDPGSPDLSGSIAVPGEAYGVSVVAGLAFVASMDNGIMVIDISVPEYPEEVNTIDTPGIAKGVKAVRYR